MKGHLSEQALILGIRVLRPPQGSWLLLLIPSEKQLPLPTEAGVRRQVFVTAVSPVSLGSSIPILSAATPPWSYCVSFVLLSGWIVLCKHLKATTLAYLAMKAASP